MNEPVKPRIYLDHAATTPILPVAIEAMTRQLTGVGNASSLHASGRGARRVVDESRETIAGVIGARPGVLEEVEAPLEPPWMRSAGLECQCFEHVPRIDAQWLVTEWSTKGFQARRIDLESGPAEDAAAEDMRAWCQAVLACDPDSVKADDRDAWAELRERATIA